MEIGPDRNGGPAGVKYRNFFVLRVSEAMGLSESEARFQRSSFTRLASRFSDRDDRADILDWCVAEAAECSDPILRNRSAAFQKRVDAKYPPPTKGRAT